MFQTILRELIEEKCHGSQKELSVGINIPPATVNKWYNGISEPNCKQLIRLANYFECSIDYLVGREDYAGIVNIDNNLTDFQRRLLDIVNKLPRDDQFQVLGFAQALQNK